MDTKRHDVVAGRRLGVELICSMPQVAPSSYYEIKTRKPSERTQRDAVMGPVVRQLWEDNYRVYGAQKVWKAARRTGHDVGRDQVARLMRTSHLRTHPAELRLTLLAAWLHEREKTLSIIRGRSNGSMR